MKARKGRRGGKENGGWSRKEEGRETGKGRAAK